MKVQKLLLNNCHKWDNYVNQHSSGTPYHLSFWKTVIERSFCHRSYYLYAEENDEIQGIFPLFLIDSLPFGRSMVSLPFCDYGGILAKTEEVEKLLLQAAIKIAGNCRVRYLEIREGREKPHYHLPHTNHKVSVSLQLPQGGQNSGQRLYGPDPDCQSRSYLLWNETFKGCKGLRTDIRKGAGPGKGKFSVGLSRELLDEFYNIYSIGQHRLGTPVIARDFFGNLCRLCPADNYIVTVFHQNYLTGGAWLLPYKDRIAIPWAASLHHSYQEKYLNANMALYWACLSFACENGFALVDFGRSTKGTGCHRFKLQWGHPQEKQLYWYYWSRQNNFPGNPHSRYKLFTKVWQKLPLFFTRLIGPSIRKDLP